jgi:outer membrane protein TolC
MGSSSAATSLTDLYQIQIEIGNLENDISTLINREEVIVAQFNSLLNRQQKTEVYVSDLLDASPLDIALLSVSDSLFMQNPMLSMLKYEQQSLEARLKMQKQMGLPMVGLA